MTITDRDYERLLQRTARRPTNEREQRGMLCGIAEPEVIAPQVRTAARRTRARQRRLGVLLVGMVLLLALWIALVFCQALTGWLACPLLPW